VSLTTLCAIPTEPLGLYIITTVGAGLLALMGLWLNEKVKR
jgi:hypothetical protein